MTTSKPKQKIKLWPWMMVLLFIGGVIGITRSLPEPTAKSKFVSLETKDTTKTPRLPLAPHIHQLRARPDDAMIRASAGLTMLFRLLDKRTMRINQMEIVVGEIHAAPWGGLIVPIAYAPDLLIRNGEAVHGPEGHVNPAVWVELKSQDHKKFHEGWFFDRDSAQTAWDHPRFDLTFLGMLDNEQPSP